MPRSVSPSISTSTCGGPDEVVAEERPDRRPGEVRRADAVLALGVQVDPLDDRGVEAEAGGEGEVAVVDPAEVDLARLPVVGDAQQVLGRVDDVAGDAEHLAEDVRRAAGQVGERDVGADQAVGGLVDRAVAAERDDDLVALLGGLADQLGRVPLALGVERGDVVAALERVDDERAQAVGDRRRVRVDDDEHLAPVGRVAQREGLGQALEGVEGRCGHKGWLHRSRAFPGRFQCIGSWTATQHARLLGRPGARGRVLLRRQPPALPAHRRGAVLDRGRARPRHAARRARPRRGPDRPRPRRRLRRRPPDPRPRRRAPPTSPRSTSRPRCSRSPRSTTRPGQRRVGPRRRRDADRHRGRLDGRRRLARRAPAHPQREGPARLHHRVRPRPQARRLGRLRPLHRPRASTSPASAPAAQQSRRGFFQAMVGKTPSGQDEPEWLGAFVPLDALGATAAQSGLELEQIEGSNTQFTLVRARRTRLTGANPRAPCRLDRTLCGTIRHARRIG